MTTNALKILALFAMLIDHIGLYFSNFTPDWFRWIGRISFPIFIFCLVVGYFHSKGRRKKYLLRIYAMGVLMALINLLIVSFFAGKYYGAHNIFINFILIMLIVSAIENFKTRPKIPFLIFLGLFLAQIFSLIILAVFFGGDLQKSLIISGIFPSFLFLEYDFRFVMFGVALYFAQKNRALTALIFVIFSAIFWFSGQNYQWMMIFALVPILFYNGRPGAKMNALFYYFYPLHLVILFLLSL